jgi:CBS domain-containing protein
MPNRSIRSVMGERAPVCAPDTMKVCEAARLMKEHNVGALLVLDEQRRLTGIFTERDGLFRVLAGKHDVRTMQVKDAMTRNPKTVHPDKAFGYALLMMFDGGFRHVPVVENGRPIGVVSARDALGPELRDFDAELDHRDHLREIM